MPALESKPHRFIGQPNLNLRLDSLRLQQYYLSAIHVLSNLNH